MPFSATLASADSKFQELDERKTNEGDRISLYRFGTSTTEEVCYPTESMSQFKYKSRVQS